jgi:hypothetical protein
MEFRRGTCVTVTVEVFPASEGDAILISNRNHHILIDAGLSNTYHQYLKERLSNLTHEGGELDLFIITHIDRDHIEGAIELLKDNGVNHSPSIVTINHIWHNSYRHLQFSKINLLGNSERNILEGIIASGMKKRGQLQNEAEEISSKQGSTLAALILKGGYRWNEANNGKAINIDDLTKIQFDGYTIKLLSPDSKKLQALAGYWEKELQKQKYNFVFSSDEIFDDAFEFSMLFDKSLVDTENRNISRSYQSIEELISMEEISDTSVTNGSSIAFILEIENKKILLLGDSHSDIIMRQLSQLMEEQQESLSFDLVKISHHGSMKNTSSQLLDLFNCDKFVISTDGRKHGHPDKVTLAKIITKSKNPKINIYCNYRTENSLFFEQFRIENKNYSFIFAEEGKPLIITL